MKSLNLNSKIILGSFIALSILPLINKPSTAAINCRGVESFGNRFQSQILSEMNKGVAGKSYKINRRKRLIIRRVETVSFDGCRIKAKTKVTLKRKIRRDAHGNVKIRADITSFNLASKRLCYRNAKVTDVNLSRTLRIGERVYKWVANKALPNGKCINL
ncbi:hypothetical protein Riv7116_4433 [Rivularia sp. PCC 7116]|uniref:hypothetical protein n=1 Tax=Rivularia sp. PCC 7116 TaxID=373994 RepID=UPI00029EECF5|nr:hypothetical protein [Rivularia sp. PCC 7116]AFY56854.1 hypothetical protein Riv7116_4433 [Rivularia sp. PCC 7116]